MRFLSHRNGIKFLVRRLIGFFMPLCCLGLMLFLIACAPSLPSIASKKFDSGLSFSPSSSDDSYSSTVYDGSRVSAGQGSCAQMETCAITCANATDDTCYNNCYNQMTANAKVLYTAVDTCWDQADDGSCGQQWETCLENACSSQYYTCTADSACKTIASCAYNCGTDSCYNACIAAGSSAAQSLFNAYKTCHTNAKAHGSACDSSWDTCWEQACTSQLSACRNNI
jgi:hypothetical protein